MKYKHDRCDSWGWIRKEKVIEGGKETGGVIEIFYCPIHEIETCRCGIEWGKHVEYYQTLKHKKNICQE